MLQIILLAVLAVLLVTTAWAGWSAAPWVPQRRRDVRRMLSVAGVARGELVYDLGAGDGRILIGAARDFGARAIGYEVSALMFIWALTIIKLTPTKPGSVRLRYGNFYTKDLSDADVVCAFLTPKAMAKLRPKFEAELKPGARVVSYAFSVPGWKPDRVDKPDGKNVSVFRYVMGRT